MSQAEETSWGEKKNKKKLTNKQKNPNKNPVKTLWEIQGSQVHTKNKKQKVIFTCTYNSRNNKKN